MLAGTGRQRRFCKDRAKEQQVRLAESEETHFNRFALQGALDRTAHILRSGPEDSAPRV